MNKKELSKIKHELFAMLAKTGKQEVPDYESLIETLDELSFRHCSLDTYSTQLVGVINDMLDLDDLAFDPNQLNHYLKQLSR